MKKFLLTSLSAFLLMFFSTAAFAVTYNMNSLAQGSYNEATFNSFFTGVSFNNTGGNSFMVTAVSLQADFSGNAILNQPYDTVKNSTIATFGSLTDSVSVTMGDYNSDADTLYLIAYNSSNVQIAMDTFVNPYSSYAGHTLSVASLLGDIAYVEFYGVGMSNNSVYWDNFTFNENTQNAPVPEPTTMILLGTGFAGLVGLRRKNKK